LCIDHLFLADLALWICAQEQKNVRSLKTNEEEEEEFVDIAPHWGEPRISCVDELCAMLLMFFIFLSSYLTDLDVC
jgi:hypothetical protein